MVARFVLRIGNREVLLHPGRWRVGRDAGCEVRIDHESVSRRHATLEVGDNSVHLEDQGSRNGVRINQQRVYVRTALVSGDEVCVGSETFHLLVMPDFAADDAPAPTKPLPQLGEEDSEAISLLATLSKRERQVLELLALGHPQREVGERLGVSIKTVDTYRARINHKLGLENRADLVRFALDAGVLRPEG